jgi:hypothetical protein
MMSTTRQARDPKRTRACSHASTGAAVLAILADGVDPATCLPATRATLRGA